MGRYVNSGNSAFQVALNSEIYINKTELISYTNKVLDTNSALICSSRPRRFGKSITANMLVAYYSRGCDSREMFEGKKISSDETFREHLNKYDVIHFDVQWCRASVRSAEATVSYIERNIIDERFYVIRCIGATGHFSTDNDLYTIIEETLRIAETVVRLFIARFGGSTVFNTHTEGSILQVPGQ